MTILLLITYLLNIADYLFTANLVRKFGVEIEANPIGRWLFENNIAAFVKLVCIGGMLLLLYVFRRYKIARIGSWIVFIVYALLTIYHIVTLIIISTI